MKLKRLDDVIMFVITDLEIVLKSLIKVFDRSLSIHSQMVKVGNRDSLFHQGSLPLQTNQS